MGCTPLADSLSELGELPDAEEHLGRALAVFREFTDRRSEASTLMRLGDVSSARGEPDAARRFWTQAAVLYEELGDESADVLRRRAEDVTVSGSGEEDVGDRAG